MIVKLFLTTLICSFIGWITNFLAIKMLFHPRQPITIANLTIQGIFPKRQKSLALNLAAVIEGELLSHEDIQQALQGPEFKAQLKENILDGFTKFLSQGLGKLHPMVAMFLDSAMLDKIRTMLDEELDTLVPKLLDVASNQIENSLNLRQIIQDKIENLSMERLETLLMSIMAKEFRFVELVGAVLGAVIGLVQGLLFL